MTADDRQREPLVLDGASMAPSTVDRPTIARDLRQLIVDGHKFRTVLADPPWRYDNTASRGAAANHYNTKTTEEICSEPVRELVEDDAQPSGTKALLNRLHG